MANMPADCLLEVQTHLFGMANMPAGCLLEMQNHLFGMANMPADCLLEMQTHLFGMANMPAGCVCWRCKLTCLEWRTCRLTVCWRCKLTCLEWRTCRLAVSIGDANSPVWNGEHAGWLSLLEMQTHLFGMANMPAGCVYWRCKLTCLEWRTCRLAESVGDANSPDWNGEHVRWLSLLEMQTHLFGMANMPAGLGQRLETDPSALRRAVGISITDGVSGGRVEAAAARSVGPGTRRHGN